MASSTRSKKDVFLLGSDLENLHGSKLPSNGDVLRLYINKLQLASTKHEAAVTVIKEVQLFWNKARIPMRRSDHAVAKLEDLIQKWEGLKKNKSRRTATQVTNEEAFSETFSDLFDVAHQDAMQMINIKEDKEFLLAQREKGRRGVMVGVDMKLTKKEEAKEGKLHRQLQLEEKQQLEIAAMDRSVSLDCCSSICSSDDDRDSDLEMELGIGDDDDAPTGQPGSIRKRKRGTTNIFTPAVLSSLDRTKTSDRMAVQILAPIIKATGEDIGDISINRSSIRRYRQKHRAIVSLKLKSEFNPHKPLVLHWDGKLMQDLTGDEKVDRLPIIVSGSGTEQLLCIPKLSTGTGKAMADAIIDTLSEWGLADSIKALSFDTTSSNTGRMNGACTLLEQHLGRSVLHLACRHHIHEIMLEEAFRITMGPSSGPEILLFKRFKVFWPNIRCAEYKPGIDDPAIAGALVDVLNDTKTFLTNQLQMNHQREDYRELLELALLFVGGVPQRGVTFRKPGAIHRARFMARLIYALKIFLFRSAGFKLTNRERRGLSDFCVFGVTAYVKSWFLSSLPTEAPANDLNLLKQLVSSQSAVAQGALKKLCGQLWYLSEELIGLAFFDRKVDAVEKRAMIAALSRKGSADPPKRINVDQATIASKKFHDFVTSNTWNFFQILSIPNSFLSADPESWVYNDSYLEAETVVRELRVVNDTAERGVALMQDYNCSLTKNEEQMQFALQVVKEHRKRFSDSNKSTILHGLTTA
jgi:hypothetical protein